MPPEKFVGWSPSAVISLLMIAVSVVFCFFARLIHGIQKHAQISIANKSLNVYEPCDD